MLILGALASARTLVGAVHDSDRELARAAAEHGRHLHRVAQSQVNVTGVGFSPVPNPIPILEPVEGNMHLNVTNTGGVTLNASRTMVLFNGTAQAGGDFRRRTVNGITTSVWAPGEVLWMEVRIAQGTAFTHVWVAADTGATDANRK